MKLCSVDGCCLPSFGKDKITGNPYCARHQWKRTDTRQRGRLKAGQSAADIDFYLTIWGKRPHVCGECDLHLGDEPRRHYFHHILEKGADRWKHLRHEEENIELLCFDCHQEVTNGHLSTKQYRLKAATLLFFKEKGLL